MLEVAGPPHIRTSCRLRWKRKHDCSAAATIDPFSGEVMIHSGSWVVYLPRAWKRLQHDYMIRHNMILYRGHLAVTITQTQAT